MIGDAARIGQLFYPSATILYLASCAMWNVSVSNWFLMILALATLLANIYVFHREYYAGTIEVEKFPDGTKRFSLNLEEDPTDLDLKKRVIFDIEVSRN